MNNYLKYFLIFFLISRATSQNISTILKNIETKLDSKTTNGSTKRLGTTINAPSIVQSFSQHDLTKYENLSDFLSYEASVHTVEKNNGNYILETRNLTNDTHNNKAMIMINGHKFVSNHLGPEFLLDVIPYESIKRLEVIKGTGSILYGSNIFSVLINIITFDGGGYEKSKYKLTFSPNNIQSAQLNLFDQQNDLSNLFISVKLHRDSSAHNVSHLSQKTGYLEDFQSNYGSKNIFGVYKYKNNTLSFGHKNSHNKTTYNDLTGYTDIQSRAEVIANLLQQAPYTNMIAGGTPRSTVIGLATDKANQLLTTGPGERESYHLNKHSFVGFHTKRQISKKTDYDFSVTWNNAKSDLWLKEVFPGILDHSSSYETELQINHQFNEKIFSTFGYNRESIKASEYVPGFTHFGIGLRPPLNIVKDYRFTNSALYAQTQISLSEKLMFLAASRFDQNQSFGQTHSPKFALSYTLRPNEVIKAIYGKNFRWPSIFEKFFKTTTLVTNPNIKPEEIISSEIQWIKRVKNNRYSVAFYTIDLKDSLSLEHFLDSTGNRLIWYNNSDSATHRGIEISIKSQLSDKTSMFSAIGYHNVNQTSKVPINVLTPVENLNQIQIGLTHEINDRWKINTYSAFFGNRSGTKYNAQKLDYEPTKFSSYALHNLTLQYKINQLKKFKIAVTNLFNKKYVANSGALFSSRQGGFPKSRQIILSYTAEF